MPPRGKMIENIIIHQEPHTHTHVIKRLQCLCSNAELIFSYWWMRLAKCFSCWARVKCAWESSGCCDKKFTNSFAAAVKEIKRARERRMSRRPGELWRRAGCIPPRWFARPPEESTVSRFCDCSLSSACRSLRTVFINLLTFNYLKIYV